MYCMSATCERAWRPSEHLWLMFGPGTPRSVQVSQVCNSSGLAIDQ
jgi:hypothetical protein